MIKRIPIIFSVLLFIAFLCISLSTKAQFSYAEAGISYSITPMGSGGMEYAKTTYIHNQLQASVAFFHRPFRWGAIGVKLGIPVVQFHNVEPDYSGSMWSEFGLYDGLYEPTREEYDIQQSIAITGIFRYFITKGDHQLFVDATYTFSSIEEEYRLSRPFSTPPDFTSYENYPDIPAVSINETERRQMLMPGLSVGYMGMLSDHFYFSGALHFDLLIFSGNGFSQTIVSGVNDSNDFVFPRFLSISSQLSDTKVSFSPQLSVGTYF